MILIIVNVLFISSFTAAQDTNGLRSILGDAASCLTSNGFEDKYLGSVQLDKSRDCQVDPQEKDATCLRTVVCCAPQKPSDVIETFRLFYPRGGEKNLTWSDERSARHLEECSKVVYVIHGYQNFFEKGKFNRPVTEAWLKKGSCVLFVDWRRGSGKPYFQAASNTLTVGMAVAYSIKIWGVSISSSCIICSDPFPHQIQQKTLVTGFSLGGQTTGIAGKQYKRMTGGGQLQECHMIDPAGPYFDGCAAHLKIQPDDCRVTQVLHSSAQRSSGANPLSGYGSYRKAGKCDYWINCGYMGDQTGCTVTGIYALLSLGDKSCDHNRAPRVYVAHLSGDCSFRSRNCPKCSNPLVQNGTGIDRCLGGAGPENQPFMLDNECRQTSDYYVKVVDGEYPYCNVRQDNANGTTTSRPFYKPIQETGKKLKDWGVGRIRDRIKPLFT